MPTSGTCNYIFDPRYLSKEELANGNFRINSEMMQHIAGFVDPKKTGLYLRNMKKETYLNPKTLKNMQTDSSQSKTQYEVANFLKNNYTAIDGALKISKSVKRQQKVAKQILTIDLAAQDIQKRPVVKKHQKELEKI